MVHTPFPHFGVRLQVRLKRIKQEGVYKTLMSMLCLAATLVGWLVLLPVSIALHLRGYRRLTIVTNRIGHLAAEVDSFLKAKALGELPKRRWFILAPPGRVANQHLLGYWSRHIRVISNPVLVLLLSTMTRWLWAKFDTSHYVLRLNASQQIYAVNRRWSGRAPILSLDHEDTDWANTQLSRLGLPKGAWFVCVHVREAGFSPLDDSAHTHRNARLEQMLPAMRAMTARGGWCIRMGDPGTTPLPPMEQVIDYAHHGLRSQRLDVVLCAGAHYFLGNTSGLAILSSVFGVPCALVNMIPTSALGICPNDLSIPKLLWLEAESRLLRFDEIMASPIGNFRYAKLFQDAGIRPLENSAEDIAGLAEEMLERLDGSYTQTPEDGRLHDRFQALLKPGHYSYGSVSQVGAAFLRNHRDLLPTVE